jgi:hypothetical protein
MPDGRPVASLESLKRDGLDLTKYGSCAERQKKNGKPFILGCPHHAECKWANQPTEPIEVDGVVGEPGLRPRNFRYVIVHKGIDGVPRVRESYCSCFQWHEHFSGKHGRNNTVIKITGKEGDVVRKRGSKKIAAKEPGQDPTWETYFWKEKVPVFQPPKEEGYDEAKMGEEIIRESGMRDEREAERMVLGGDPLLADTEVDLSEEEISKIVGR